MKQLPSPSWRKPAGMFLILGLIAIWAFVIGSFSETIGRLPGWAQIPVYVVSGIIWIMPLRPLLAWMETGRWRPEKSRLFPGENGASDGT